MIITIWGNNGSGKSTLAIKLANAFVRRKKNVVLIDTDFSAPQLNVWYPRLSIKPEQSLFNLIDNNIDSVEQIAAKIHVISENMGVLGYAKDYTGNLMTRRSEPAGDMLRMLPEVCDITIVDCRSDIMDDIVSYTALSEAADERIIAITPDVKGLSWYDSNVRMFDENWTNNKAHVIKMFNKTSLTAPVADIENSIGSADFYLPFDSYIERELYAGTMGTEGYRKGARKYARVVDSIADEVIKHQSKVK